MQKYKELLAQRQEERWRRDNSRERRNRIIRWCVAVPLMLSYPWLGPLSPFLVLLGVILATPDLTDWLTGWVDSILWSRRRNRPEAVYGIARTLAARGKYAEAEAEYEKIIREFPDDVRSHAEMIEIAITRLNDPQLAEQLYQRGLQTLQKTEGREALTKNYERLKSLLKTEADMSRHVMDAAALDKARDTLTRKRRQYWR